MPFCIIQQLLEICTHAWHRDLSWQLHPNIEVTGNNVAMRYQAPVIPFHVPGNDSPRHCPNMIWMSLAPKKTLIPSWFIYTKPIKCSCPNVGTLSIHNKVALAVGNKIDVKQLLLEICQIYLPNIPGLSPCQPWTRCHTLGHLWHGSLSTKSWHASQFELVFLRWKLAACLHFWPHKKWTPRRTPLHILHHGLLRRFRRSSAKALFWRFVNTYGDRVHPKYTHEIHEDFGTQSHWRWRGTFFNKVFLSGSSREFSGGSKQVWKRNLHFLSKVHVLGGSSQNL